jgi:hypothetical protein
MHVLPVVLLLIPGLLGLTAGATAEPIGPVCLERSPSGEILELFIQPSGGPNFLISGRIGPAGTGVPISGSGYVTGGSFRFSLAGQAPNVAGRFQITDGVFDAATSTATGRCYTIGISTGCGSGTPVTYTTVACPPTDGGPAVGSDGG